MLKAKVFQSLSNPVIHDPTTDTARFDCALCSKTVEHPFPVTKGRNETDANRLKLAHWFVVDGPGEQCSEAKDIQIDIATMVQGVTL